MLSEEIIKLRKKDGLSQREFADLVGVTRQMVSLWERGVFLPDDEHLQAICRAFGLPKQYFAQAASASEAEQEVAVAASAAPPAPVCGSDGRPCAHCRKFRPKKNNKVVKGLIIGGLLLVMAILVLVIGIFLAITFDGNYGIGRNVVSDFSVPMTDIIVILSIVLAGVIALILYIILKPIIAKRKTRENNKEKRE